MLDDIITEFYDKIKSEWKLAFISAFAIGLITHLYKFTNTLLNHDTVATQYHHINVITSGRWFLTFVGGISSYFDLPWILGLLSILYLSFLAVVIIEIYSLKSKTAIVLCAGLIVSFPITSAILSYETYADAYIFGMLLAACALLLYLKNSHKSRIKGIFASGILLGMSMGIYQSNVTFCISLILVWIIQQISRQNKVDKHILRNIIDFLICGIWGAIFYYFCLNICFKLQHKGFGTYQGMGTIGEVALLQYKAVLLKIYQEFAGFFFEPLNNITLYSIINLVLIVIVILDSAWRGTFLDVFLKCKRKQLRWQNLVLLVACFLLLPIGNYLYYFVSPDVIYHKLMIYGLVVVYIMIIIYYDNYEDFWNKKRHFGWILRRRFALFGLLSLMIFNFMLIDNIAYYNMNLRCQRDYALSVRILNRMEMLDGFDRMDEFAIVGGLSERYYNTAISRTVSNRIPDLTGMTGDRILYADYQYWQYYDCYMGVNLKYASKDQINNVKSTMDFLNMGTWPSKDSVAIIDDIIVVKLSDK